MPRPLLRRQGRTIESSGFNLTTIALIFAGSAIGFVYFRFGKRQARVPFIVCGIALMGYGYFVDSPLGLVAVGAALAAAQFLWERFL